jgi:hypothetical protein
MKPNTMVHDACLQTNVKSNRMILIHQFTVYKEMNSDILIRVSQRHKLPGESLIELK